MHWSNGGGGAAVGTCHWWAPAMPCPGPRASMTRLACRGWLGLDAAACPWHPAGSVLPWSCTGDFNPICFVATLPWLSLPVFPEVSGPGPMMEEHGYCHLSTNELCDLCSCFPCGCEERLRRTSASRLLHCRITQRFHQNMLVLRDLALGEKPELDYKQSVKCGAMETSAIPTRLGMDPVSIGGSFSFLPSRIPKTWTPLEELHVCFNATAAFKWRLHWSGEFALTNGVLAAFIALASQWTIPFSCA